MLTENTPPAYGLSAGPIIVACQWNMSLPAGPNSITSLLYSNQEKKNQHDTSISFFIKETGSTLVST
jgi:hypothetical protein